MGESAGMNPDEARLWARARRAAFEVQPLVEAHDGQRVTVGFEVNLYAGLATEGDAEERSRDAEETHARLVGLLESVLTAEHPTARVEIAPRRAGVKLRPEAGYRPEIVAEARIARRSETFEPLAGETRQKLQPLEDALLDLGLRRGGWGA